MAISPRLLKGSQPNFPCRWQMGWNRKHGVKLLKSIGVKLGSKMSFLGGPAHTTANIAMREFFKKVMVSDSGYINSVLNGENHTKMRQAKRKKRWQICTYLGICE